MDKKKNNIIKYIEKNISDILCKDHYTDQMVYDNLIKKES
jgi:hypothetical protein